MPLLSTSCERLYMETRDEGSRSVVMGQRQTLTTQDGVGPRIRIGTDAGRMCLIGAW